MAKSEGQKLKLFYILQILKEKSDKEHVISTQAIINELAAKEISAERKSIYADIDLLKSLGYDIVLIRAKENSGYYLNSREFELAELKLLVDAVSASKFMPVAKSKTLIKKLEKLASPYEAQRLQRQVYVSDRIKSDNNSVLTNVDEIHKAMQDNKMISFKYYEWGVDKKMHFRRNGEKYQVSPYMLIWKDENYYLVAYDDKNDMIKHYRVDKMAEIMVSWDNRKGQKLALDINPATYAQKRFSMFQGEEKTVVIQFPENLSGVIFDKFGRDLFIRKRDENLYSVRVNVAVSDQFFGWVTGMGGKLKIIGPQSVALEYREFLRKVTDLYDE